MTAEMSLAVAEGDIDLVWSHLKSSHIGITSSVLDNQLDIAFENRDSMMIKLLLKYGADPNMILLKAIHQKQYMIMEQLIRFGVNVNRHVEGTFSTRYYQPAVPRRTIPLICHAILSNDESMSLLLLRNGANIRAADSEGDTVLSYALHMKMRFLATMLISKRCNINARNNDGYTICHVAGMSCFNSTVATLLDKRADESNHPEGKTLLHLAADYDEDYRVLVEDDYADYEMYIFDELLKRGYEANAQDNLGNTALHRIMEKLPEVANPETAYIITNLLSVSADISIKNEIGQTPITLMAQMPVMYDDCTLARMAILNFDPMMRHLVWLDLKGIKRLRQEDRNAIEKHAIMKRTMDIYKSQVAEMRKIKYNGVSIADFFSVDLRRIAALAGDLRVVRSYKRLDKQKRFPAYADDVERIWNMAVKKQDWLVTLKPILNQHLPPEMILEIVQYLD